MALAICVSTAGGGGSPAMRSACSFGPACAVAANCSSSTTEPATVARRARPEPTCACVLVTFMALVNSRNCPMRGPDYTVSNIPPRMSQSPYVATNRQFDQLLFRTAQCAANCEPGHGEGLI